MSVQIQMQSQNFQHILRMCNTNVDGRQKVMYALTAIRGIGRRISNIVCKKCDIDLNKRAGELTTDEVNKIVAVVSKPLEFKIPAWMLNRNRDVKDGKTGQKYANFLDQALRSKPLEFKIPAWMLNRNRDVKDGKTGQKYANFLDQALREDAWLNALV
eukprot:s6424_g2.t1